MAASSPNPSTPSTPTLRQEFSLCRVYKKSKCLRAFDRRPPGIEITRNPNLNIQAAPAQTADHLDQGMTTSNRNSEYGRENKLKLTGEFILRRPWLSILSTRTKWDFANGR
ncbi:hypothetical protein C1H46_027391 [Malus baccata]|uniref:NAC domain-containing protein n=1 Tax=Malus baccata TaxID=106549 RepID=A0A540LKQ8_MALBA|nr:hypothetical protein C1H46_027391 [Malus baccata]